MAVPVNDGQGVVIELNVTLGIPCDNIAEMENSISLLNNTSKYYALNTKLYARLWIPGVGKTSRNTAL